MLSYSTDKKSYWPYILKRALIIIAIYAALVVALKLYQEDVNNSIYWILGGVLVIAIINTLDHELIQHVQINEDSKTISYRYSSPLNGQGEKVHILSQVQLYTKIKNTTGNRPEVTSLTLYKNRRKVLRLDAKADGFTPDKLAAIREQLHQFGVTE